MVKQCLFIAFSIILKNFFMKLNGTAVPDGGKKQNKKKNESGSKDSLKARLNPKHKRLILRYTS